MPRIDSKISIGDLVAIVVALLSVGMIYGQVNARIDFIDENGTKDTRSLREEMTVLRIEVVKLQTILEERMERENANKR